MSKFTLIALSWKLHRVSGTLCALVMLPACDFEQSQTLEEASVADSAYQYPYRVYTALGPKSGINDDDVSAVSCPVEYTLTGCDCYSTSYSCDGAYASSAVCYAFNNGGGSGVYAVAQCLRTDGSIADTQDLASARSGIGDDNPASVSCPLDYALTSCTCYSPWASCDGAYPQTVGGLETCTAFNMAGGNGVYAQARCTALGETSSQYVAGPRSGIGNHAASSASCASGYSLTGCACYSPWASCEGARPSGTDTCTAYNKVGGNGVYARAICVSIEN